MKFLYKIISLCLTLIIIQNMICILVKESIALTQEIDDTTSENQIYDDNIPHDNVVITPTDEHITGKVDISANCIKLSEYYNSKGELVSELIEKIYGNVLFCRSTIGDWNNEVKYYLKSVIDGKIIHVFKNAYESQITEYVADSAGKNKVRSISDN